MHQITRETTFNTTHIAYRGINGKINHPHEHYKWCFYICLHLNQFQDEKLAKSLWIKANKEGYFGYLENSFIRGLDFHCGCTFYAKSIGHKDTKVIELGCDYGHYWDEGREYGLDYVKSELCSCIDSVHASTKYLLFEHSKGDFIEEENAYYAEGGYVYPKRYALEKGWLKEEVLNEQT